ncbi:MAG: PTS glucose transporter subunit IIA [Collinsella sp.]
MFTSFFKTLGVGARTTTLAAPMAGHVIPLSEVEDQMFAKGLLGRGVAMVPTGDRVVAPSDGKIEAIFPTGHAVADAYGGGAHDDAHSCQKPGRRSNSMAGISR